MDVRTKCEPGRRRGTVVGLSSVRGARQQRMRYCDLSGIVELVATVRMRWCMGDVCCDEVVGVAVAAVGVEQQCLMPRWIPAWVSVCTRPWPSVLVFRRSLDWPRSLLWSRQGPASGVAEVGARERMLRLVPRFV